MKWSRKPYQGNAPAKIDEKGRLKVPNGFRAPSKGSRQRRLRHQPDRGQRPDLSDARLGGNRSADGQGTRRAIPPGRFLDRVSYYGQAARARRAGPGSDPPAAARQREHDRRGGRLRQDDYLEVWNHERFVSKLQREPYTDDDAKSAVGVRGSDDSGHREAAACPSTNPSSQPRPLTHLPPAGRIVRGLHRRPGRAHACAARSRRDDASSASISHR